MVPTIRKEETYVKAIRVILSFYLLFVAPAVALGQKVNVDWERGAIFQQYRTYGWGLGPAMGWGPSWGWGWNGGPVTVEPVVEQKFELTVEIVDARRNQLLWRGDATDNLSHKSEKNIKRLRRAVEKLFMNYPYGD